MDHRDPVLLQMRFWANTGQHQQLRRLEAASTQNDLTPRRHQNRRARRIKGFHGRWLLRFSICNLWTFKLGQNRQIFSAHCGFEEACGRGLPLPLVCGHLVPPHAVLLGPVEVIVRREAAFNRGIDDALGYGVLFAGVIDHQRA